MCFILVSQRIVRYFLQETASLVLRYFFCRVPMGLPLVDVTGGLELLRVEKRLVVGRGLFKATNDERYRSECWSRNGQFQFPRLRPKYRRDGYPYGLAPIPDVFRSLQCYLLACPA